MIDIPAPPYWSAWAAAAQKLPSALEHIERADVAVHRHGGETANLLLSLWRHPKAKAWQILLAAS